MITDNNGVDKVYVHSGGTVADRWYRCTDVVSVDGSSGSSVSMASNVDVSPQKKVPKKARKEGKGKRRLPLQRSQWLTRATPSAPTPPPLTAVKCERPSGPVIYSEILSLSHRTPLTHKLIHHSE